jgi:site-specific DNA-methyltransferase (adenine-specific)
VIDFALLVSDHGTIGKACDIKRIAKAEVVLGLLPARPYTRYWHRDIAGSASVFFLKGRLKFGDAEQVAPFPSCLVVWGASDDLVTKLQAALPEVWLSQ